MKPIPFQPKSGIVVTITLEFLKCLVLGESVMSIHMQIAKSAPMVTTRPINCQFTFISWSVLCCGLSLMT
mgnify:CR=1 FL=1